MQRGGKTPKAFPPRRTGGKSAASFFRAPSEPGLSQGSDVSCASVAVNADKDPFSTENHFAELARLDAEDTDEERHSHPPLTDASFPMPMPVGAAIITLHQEVSMSPDPFSQPLPPTPPPVPTPKKRSKPLGTGTAKAGERGVCPVTKKKYAIVPWERCELCAGHNNRGLKKCMEAGHLLRDPPVTYEEAVNLRAQRTGANTGRRAPRTPPPASTTAKRARQETGTSGTGTVPVPQPLFGQTTDLVPPKVPAPAVPGNVDADRLRQSLLAQALALQSVLYCAPSQPPISAVPLAVELIKNLVACPHTGTGPTAEHVAQLGGLIERLAADMPASERGRALGSLGAIMFGISPEGAVEQLLGLTVAQAEAGLDSNVRARIGSRLTATAAFLSGQAP